jgi:hypothetical protein
MGWIVAGILALLIIAGLIWFFKEAFDFTFRG